METSSRKRKLYELSSAEESEDSTSESNNSSFKEENEEELFQMFEKYRTAIEKGNKASKERNFLEAVLHYSEGLEMNVFDIVLYQKRCSIYMKLKYYQDAINDAKKLIALDPNNAEAYLSQGKAHLELGKREWNKNSYVEHKTQEYIDHFQKSIESFNQCRALEMHSDELEECIIRAAPYLNHFQAISNEILFVILGWLSAKELCVTSQVSKQWNKVSLDRSLWKSLFLKEFGNLVATGIKQSTVDWKMRYKNASEKKKTNHLSRLQLDLE